MWQPCELLYTCYLLTYFCHEQSHCDNEVGSTSTEKDKDSPYSITERRVPELIPVLGIQPVGDVSHEPGGRLPLLSARPAVTPATFKRAATSFALGEQRHDRCEQFA